MHSSPPSQDAPESASRERTAAQDVFLRILTCGSVDDGKSTLLGRLLYDTDSIATDVKADIQDIENNLAYLFDGLEAEREQGVTIDVTHRTFTTARGRLRLLDAPGHEEYTRNMATAASEADVAIVLVDVERGVLTQTRRHATICNLFGVRHLVVAVNKMDRVGYARARFEAVAADFMAFVNRLSFLSVTPIPVSGLRGDNVVSASERMPWWHGGALLGHLEALNIKDAAVQRPLRMPVQLVLRPDTGRCYAGTVAAGCLSVGDSVVVTPSGRSSRIREIRDPSGPVRTAAAGAAVSVSLTEEIDVGRGDVISHRDRPPTVASSFEAHILWLAQEPLALKRSYALRIGTAEVPGIVTEIRHRLDVDTQESHPATVLGANEIALCRVDTIASIPTDSFDEEPKLGCFIVMDRATHETVGAGVIRHHLRAAAHVVTQTLTIDKQARAERKQQRPVILWFTGLSGAGKSTVANLVEEKLFALGFHTMLLDGDNVRQGLCRDLSFSVPDRTENIRRIGEVSKLMLEAGLIVLCSFISPFRAERDGVRAIVAEGEFIEIFVDAPLEECVRRDSKGLYKKAMAGEISNFTGVSAAYEVPLSPDIHLDSAGTEADALATMVLRELRRRGIIEGTGVG